MADKIVLNITIGGNGIIKPQQLPALLSKIKSIIEGGGEEGIILSGRLPVWAYGALVHYFHPRPWVATFDPRLGAGVVVASHHPDFKVGDVVPVEDAEQVNITF